MTNTTKKTNTSTTTIAELQVGQAFVRGTATWCVDMFGPAFGGTGSMEIGTAVDVDSGIVVSLGEPKKDSDGKLRRDVTTTYKVGGRVATRFFLLTDVVTLVEPTAEAVKLAARKMRSNPALLAESRKLVTIERARVAKMRAERAARDAAKAVK